MDTINKNDFATQIQESEKKVDQNIKSSQEESNQILKEKSVKLTEERIKKNKIAEKQANEQLQEIGQSEKLACGQLLKKGEQEKQQLIQKIEKQIPQVISVLDDYFVSLLNPKK